jgi:hypothetical protein
MSKKEEIGSITILNGLFTLSLFLIIVYTLIYYFFFKIDLYNANFVFILEFSIIMILITYLTPSGLNNSFFLLINIFVFFIGFITVFYLNRDSWGGSYFYSSMLCLYIIFSFFIIISYFSIKSVTKTT